MPIANNENLKSLGTSLLHSGRFQKALGRQLIRLAGEIDAHQLTDEQINRKMAEVDESGDKVYDVVAANKKFNVSKAIYQNPEVVDENNEVPVEPEPTVIPEGEPGA